MKMNRIKKLVNWNSFDELADELEKVYGEDLELFSGRHHARYIDESVPYHIISRVFQGRFLLVPNRKLNRMIAGVIGRGLKNYAKVKLYAAAFMSNHMHLMAEGSAEQLAKLVGFVKREISRRLGEEINWPGTMWEEYIATALPTPKSQEACLKYILGQGVKEKLVASPLQWPGVHCARSLLTGAPLRGLWFDGTNYTRATDAQSRRKRPKPVRRNDYYEEHEVHFDAIPAWAGLSTEECRAKVRTMIETVVEEGRVARNGRKPLGAKKVMEMSRARRSELPRQPWFEDRKKLISWGDPRAPETRAHRARYWAFQIAYRHAARDHRDGIDAVFPPGAFTPGRYKPPEERPEQAAA